ncbi:MAG: ACT domain-containing protein [Aggregatilineales bacterium]
MSQTVEQALQQARFLADSQEYRLLRLPPSAITAAAGVLAEIGEPFGAVLADQHEVTLVVPAEAVADFAPRLPGYQASESVFRLITLDIALEHNLVGLMARVAAALAAAQISVMPYAAFSRDHLLVAASDLDRALAALSRLQAEI